MVASLGAKLELRAADFHIEGKKTMLTFFLAWRLPLGAQLLEGDPLYAAAEAELFDMKRMTVANSNLGAGNERERPRDCLPMAFKGGWKDRERW